VVAYSVCISKKIPHVLNEVRLHIWYYEYISTVGKKVSVSMALFKKMAGQSSTIHLHHIYVFGLYLPKGTEPANLLCSSSSRFPAWLYLKLHKQQQATLITHASNSPIFSSLLYVTGTFCIYCGF